LLVVVAVLAGCGRIAFDPRDDGGGGGSSNDGGGGGGGDGGSGAASYVIGGNGLRLNSATVSSMSGAYTDPDVVIVAAVDWRNTTSSVVSITDTAGNVYSPTAPALRFGGTLSHVVYSAPIAPGGPARTIDVTLDQAAPEIHIKWVAYRGVDQAMPIVSTQSNSGTGVTADSGPASVNERSVLLAISSSTATSGSAGPGYQQRTAVGGGVIADRDVAPGTYTATASVSTSTQWIMQLVALRPR
jgi:hypothetical protein